MLASSAELSRTTFLSALIAQSQIRGGLVLLKTSIQDQDELSSIYIIQCID